KSLAPALGRFLPDRRIASERSEQIDAFTARLLAIRVVLRQREPVTRLVRCAAHDAAQPVASFFPCAGRAADRLVILKREVARRPRIAEQLAVMGGRFYDASVVRELARLREQRSEASAELDRVAEDRQIGVPRSELLEARERLARLLQPSGARIEGAD